MRGEVRFDEGSRALYATDASNYRQPPIGVVIPRDEQDVIRAMAICRAHGAPVLPRGGGTSLAGQCCNTAVVFDLSRYLNRVVDIDVGRRLAVVEPGTILDDLRAAAEPHGLTFGPDPATHDHCTLGGMVGNDSCGAHSVMAQFSGGGARTADNIEWLDVLTYDGVQMRVGATADAQARLAIARGDREGEIYSRLIDLRNRHAEALRTGFPKIPRRVSGYNLPYLLPEHGFHLARALVGSEGTCVMVLRMAVNLIPNPGARVLVVLGFADVFAAADHVPEIMGRRPIALEGMDDRLLADMEHAGLHRQAVGLLPDGKGWLLVEFGGSDRDEAVAHAKRLIAEVGAWPHPPTSRLFDRDEDAKRLWAIRESGLGATAAASTDRPTWPGWEDSAVPPDRLAEYLRDLRRLLDTFGYRGDLYGHFGQGCVHTRIDFDLFTAAGIARYRQFVEAAADLVVRMGGSLSGEHGDGQSRGELLPRMFRPDVMAAFREFKAIWDPDGKMNPGKVVAPAALDDHLRYGANHAPLTPSTHFQFPDDGGSFEHATRRCVGVGKCRRLDGGTMCPSFMATRDEQHSTRGRARLLFEMLEQDPMHGGWQAEPVREALDLCLACKGCKGDCPVKVDMATYKAEFLSHYYEAHRRPVRAYAFGLVPYWARVASQLPRLVNLAAATPGLRTALKWSVGMSADREIPALAPMSFRTWFRRRQRPERAGRARVLFWPDTFNNYFHPRTAVAAVRVLERAGFDVTIPPRPLCCGRPLYDYGLLDTARNWLDRILTELRPALDAGLPIIGLEPSCVSVFRDELGNLFPDRADARALRNRVSLLSEFLQHVGVAPPQLRRRAIVHGHCHHKAVFDFEAEAALLRSMDLDLEVLDSGCCGMAGAFGFEADHAEISRRIGERVLAPAVRRAAEDAIIIADGFSCREQIRQMTGRRALHLADVLDMAAREGPEGPPGAFPERAYAPDYAGAARAAVGPSLAIAGAVALAGAAAWYRGRPGRRARGRTPGGLS